MSTPPVRIPTTEQFAAFQRMFDYFNHVLFADQLPHAILTIDRHTGACGYYIDGRWISPDGEITPEIGLGAKHLATGPLDDVVSTVVHEMAHHWQRCFGTPGRRGYHNEEWASKMETIGLMPSHTGKPGGRRVGDQMDHWILPDGPYARAFAAMPAECRLPWQAREIVAPAPTKVPCLEEIPTGVAAIAAAPAKTRNKVKYTCPSCATNIWGKPDLHVICGDCCQRMETGVRAAAKADREAALSLH